MTDPKPVQHTVQTAKEAVLQIDFEQPSVAAGSYIALLESLIKNPVDQQSAIPLFEEMRKPLHNILQALYDQYHNTSIPMPKAMYEAFRLSATNLRLMANFYAQIVKQMKRTDLDQRGRLRASTLLHRYLYYLSALAMAHFRARRELPKGIWLEAHAAYAKASHFGLAMATVDDALDILHPTSTVKTVYIRLMLMDTANTYSIGAKDIDSIERWAAMWCERIHIESYVPGKELPSFYIDFNVDTPLVSSKELKGVPESACILNTNELELELRNLLNKLRDGVSPVALSLGQESGEYTSQLLSRVAFSWTQMVLARRFRRHDSKGSLQLSSGFESIHRLLSSGELKIQNQLTEMWSITNYSAQGFRIQRASAGRPVRHGQLVAIRPENAEDMLLAQISWLMQGQNGDITAGIFVLPGVPEPVWVSTPSSQKQGNAGEVTSRAFLLPSVSSIEEEASLVLVPHCTTADRRATMHYENKRWSVRFLTIQQRGQNFERVYFSIG